ncbi:hypothetical protein EG68_08288 [Paragonimus skrjabini miyazakii]|uniref:Uncharacterized protein n=1 Tax=Paragonimus skrjabini miyazakii TaxID=59628 RepID=A0A8S9YML6_9TREM|nr:hypothetical protein EG68_08288 [Paragonimus skrjabini miyazakii]
MLQSFGRILGAPHNSTTFNSGSVISDRTGQYYHHCLLLQVLSSAFSCSPMQTRVQIFNHVYLLYPLQDFHENSSFEAQYPFLSSV